MLEERFTMTRFGVMKHLKVLEDAGLVVTVRKTRGDDIDAACGQLAGQVRDKTQRQEKWIRIAQSDTE